MRKSSAHRKPVSVAVVVALAMAFLLTGGMVHAADDPACPGDQAVFFDSGPTSIVAHGTTTFTASQVDPNSLGGGTLTWNVKGVISGPNTNATNEDLTGFLTATVDWNDSKPNTTFLSDCVAYVLTSVGNFAGQYVGTVLNEPTFSSSAPAGGGADSAEALLTLKRIRAGVADLLFVLGQPLGTCGEVNPFTINRPAASAHGHKTGNGGRAVVC